MCGIVGYVGAREATPILLGGLRRLEYRGYDSAGIAVGNGGQAHLVRCQGKLAALEKLLADERPVGGYGIGHTRWATHGRPSDENAHPHKAGPISVVHNGIVENHVELRERLIASGRHFSSQTDTEVLAHLIDEALQAGAASLVEAVRAALVQVKGAFAIVVLSDNSPVCWWRRRMHPRWWWGSGKARCSSPRTQPPSWNKPARCCSSRTAT